MQLQELSLFSDDSAPAVTRILFTQNDVMARRLDSTYSGHAAYSILSIRR